MIALRRRVLIVDDEEAARSSYLSSLRGARCNVEAVPDGTKALRAMERQPFDVVMVDLSMPGGEDMSVLRTIKERWPDSEVIVITGHPSIETAKEAVRLGACDYLAKPVGAGDVIHAASAAMLKKMWALRSNRPDRAVMSDRSAAAAARENCRAY